MKQAKDIIPQPRAYKPLIDRYVNKADCHGREAVLGDKKHQGYHEAMEKIYNQLIIALAEKFNQAYDR